MLYWTFPPPPPFSSRPQATRTNFRARETGKKRKRIIYTAVIYDVFEPGDKSECTGSNQVCTSDRTLLPGRKTSPIYRIYRTNLFRITYEKPSSIYTIFYFVWHNEYRREKKFLSLDGQTLIIIAKGIRQDYTSDNPNITSKLYIVAFHPFAPFILFCCRSVSDTNDIKLWTF